MPLRCPQLPEKENIWPLKNKILSLLKDWYAQELIFLFLDITEQRYNELLKQDVDFATEILLIKLELQKNPKSPPPAHKVLFWNN